MFWSVKIEGYRECADYEMCDVGRLKLLIS